jgi:hypothetical protein
LFKDTGDFLQFLPVVALFEFRVTEGGLFLLEEEGDFGLELFELLVLLELGVGEVFFGAGE